MPFTMLNSDGVYSVDKPDLGHKTGQTASLFILPQLIISSSRINFAHPLIDQLLQVNWFIQIDLIVSSRDNFHITKNVLPLYPLRCQCHTTVHASTKDAQGRHRISMQSKANTRIRQSCEKLQRLDPCSET